MSWTRIDDGFLKNRKVRKLLARNGIDGMVAIGWWTLMLSDSVDGIVDRESALVAIPTVEPDRMAEMLLDVGLFDETGSPGVWAFHDWSQYNGTVNRNRAGGLARARQASRDTLGRMQPADTQQHPAIRDHAGQAGSPAKMAPGETAGDQADPSRPVPPPPVEEGTGRVAPAPAREDAGEPSFKEKVAALGGWTP